LAFVSFSAISTATIGVGVSLVSGRSHVIR
jgi:hypothetical protein